MRRYSIIGTISVTVANAAAESALVRINIRNEMNGIQYESGGCDVKINGTIVKQSLQSKP